LGSILIGSGFSEPREHCGDVGLPS
jgi:hypothetical protein